MSTGIDIVLLTILLVIALIVGIVIGGMLGSRRQRRLQAAHLEDRPGTPSELARASGPEHQAVEAAPARPRVAIVINPSKIGAEEFAKTAAAVCRQEGWDAPLMYDTEIEDPGYAMASQALAEEVDLVVAAGGDGTVRAVAEVLAGTGVPMGIVPMGTGNLLARNLKIVLDRPEWALRIALWGKDEHIDVARARIEPGGKDHAFMVMSGLGFDAAVMADTDEELKSRVGWLAYLEAGSRKLAGHRTRVQVSVDDEEPYMTKIRSVIGGNCGRLQGGVMLLPEAEYDDGILDVIIISPKNMADWVGVAASILGRHKRRGIHTNFHRCRRIVVEAEEPIEVQLDGDAVGASRYLEMWLDERALVVRTATREQTRLIRLEGWPIPVP
ncbi:diacylglycerol kinase family protein [Brevibacterium daeguense]|uniref:Diacylglycerol kinase family protein n=1 Tax=Brevibacterium daeguense TaxID=909936 RepID=A0ABP8EKQ6_9MICO|nr:diacylglycerol kinase family protein [Brevibacterium daeguense]